MKSCKSYHFSFKNIYFSIHEVHIYVIFVLFKLLLFLLLGGGTNEGANQPIHKKTWFVFFMCFISLMLVVLCVVCVAAVRWNSNRKGHKYPGNGVKHSFYCFCHFKPAAAAYALVYCYCNYYSLFSCSWWVSFR